MTFNKLYAIEIQLKKIYAKISLNDFPVLTGEFVQQISSAHKGNSSLIGGINLLKIELKKVANLDGTEYDPEFKLILKEDDTPIVEYTLDSAAKANLTTEKPIIVLEQEFECPMPWQWQWQSAPTVILSAPIKNEIISMLQIFCNTLEQKNIASVLSSQDIQLTEQAQSLNLDVNGVKNRYTIFLKKRMAVADWQVEPIDPDNLKFETVANSHIVHITDKNGFPPVVTISNGEIFAIEPFVSKIADQWRIVR